MKNSEMIAGRFAKLARSRRILRLMNAAWDRNGFVRVGTATRYTDYKASHRTMFRIGADRSLYVQSGKRWLCIDFCSFQFSN